MTPPQPTSTLFPYTTLFRSNDEEEHVFSGKRIGRRNRLYRTKDGREICADVNGAYNILRKSRPDAFSKAKGVRSEEHTSELQSRFDLVCRLLLEKKKKKKKN